MYADKITAVSYTHLDVYKRQARHEAAELGYETVDFNDPAKACFETLFLINTVPDRVIAVSYTHLDVYKRQRLYR